MTRDAWPLCGAWMPKARERCARKRGHRWNHSTADAVENGLRMRSGLPDPFIYRDGTWYERRTGEKAS